LTTSLEDLALKYGLHDMKGVDEPPINLFFSSFVVDDAFDCQLQWAIEQDFDADQWLRLIDKVLLSPKLVHTLSNFKVCMLQQLINSPT
jgi:hypothetical protein